MVAKSELNATNRMEAINTLATPVVTYSFNIVDWKLEETRKQKNKEITHLRKDAPPKIRCGKILPPQK